MFRLFLKSLYKNEKIGSRMTSNQNMVDIVDIDNVPTAVVYRLDKSAPPIILYTLKPPAYNEYNQHELIQSGPPMDIVVDIVNDEEEDTVCEQYTRCIGVCTLFLFIFLVILGIVFLSCSCF